MMSKERMRSGWYCAEKGCDNVLGDVTSDSLVVRLRNVLTVNTDGVNLVLTCNKCGNPKTWYPDVDSVIVGAYRTLSRDLERRILR